MPTTHEQRVRTLQPGDRIATVNLNDLFFLRRIGQWVEVIAEYDDRTGEAIWIYADDIVWPDV